VLLLLISPEPIRESAKGRELVGTSRCDVSAGAFPHWPAAWAGCPAAAGEAPDSGARAERAGRAESFRAFGKASPDAALGDADGAAHRPYHGGRQGGREPIFGGKKPAMKGIWPSITRIGASMTPIWPSTTHVWASRFR